MKETTSKITVSRDELVEAILKFQKAMDDNQHFNAIRIDPDGTIRLSEEVSCCVSQDEYYHQMPHTVTVLSGQGFGQCDLEEGWEDDFDCDELIEDCVEKLEDAGYEVELN